MIYLIAASITFTAYETKTGNTYKRKRWRKLDNSSGLSLSDICQAFIVSQFWILLEKIFLTTWSFEPDPNILPPARFGT